MPSESTKTGTKSAYARHRNCRPSYITALGKRGLLVMTADGLVDFAASDAAIKATEVPAMEPVRDRHQQTRQTHQERTAEESATDAPTKPYERSRLARAQGDEYRAKLLEIELAQAEGRVASVEQIQAAGVTVARNVRLELDALLPRLSPVLAAETDAHRIAETLEAEFQGVYRNLQTGLSAAAQIGTIDRERS